MMRRLKFLGLLAAVSVLLFEMAAVDAEKAGVRATGEPATTPRAAGETVACRVLEAHTDDRSGMTVVIFHQKVKADGPRLGEMMRVLDGMAVRFEKSDAKPRSATLFRLKSCFGRGLLLFPASSAHLAAGDEFELEIPTK
jgi:hypothetical protein